MKSLALALLLVPLVALADAAYVCQARYASSKLDPLRSKLHSPVQSQVRSFRRELARASKK